ncbi:hypothetical protein C5167_020651 [Papaver somniferum]|uniref:Uncharacterized protein n=1 Tax=Papaver somniferum TaxID=3469 RepID=A0A4Y7IWY0_PAPSO|nr:hypothetical protein C5167_020651 [Papaver somniferum]
MVVLLGSGCLWWWLEAVWWWWLAVTATKVVGGGGATVVSGGGGCRRRWLTVDGGSGRWRSTTRKPSATDYEFQYLLNIIETHGL